MAGLRKPARNWTEQDRLAWMQDVANILLFGAFTWDAPSVGANTSVDTEITDNAFSGLRTTHVVTVSPPSTINAGLATDAWCATSDKLTVRLTNATGSGIDPASGTWLFMGVLT